MCRSQPLRFLPYRATDVNSLINITAFVWETMEVEPAALQATPQPPDALINLRSQCENQSKQQQLYAKKPANWLDWDKAQEARVKCAAAWAKAGSLSHDRKVALLKENLVLLFHTVMPPDVSHSWGSYAYSCCLCCLVN